MQNDTWGYNIYLMKRLPAYLFLVLSFTILFQTKLYAPTLINIGDYCVTKKASWWLIKSEDRYSIGHVVTKINENLICDDDIGDDIIVSKKENTNFYNFLKSQDPETDIFHVPKGPFNFIGSYLESHEKQTQIAKKEPKKKEKKVAKKKGEKSS